MKHRPIEHRLTVDGHEIARETTKATGFAAPLPGDHPTLRILTSLLDMRVSVPDGCQILILTKPQVDVDIIVLYPPGPPEVYDGGDAQEGPL